MRIVPGDLSSDAVVALLRAHLVEMREVSPPGAAFALDLKALRAPDVTFWSILDGDTLIGCGALKELGAGEGEIKSMRTAPEHRGRGAGSLMVRHIVGDARARGYERLLLETGSSAHFEPARALYRRHGFSERGPFGDYSPHPHSCFMELELIPFSGAGLG